MTALVCPSNRTGKHDDADARGFAEAGGNGYEVRRNVGEQNALLFDGALTRQPLAQSDGFGQSSAAMRVARKQLELGILLAAVEMIDRALIGLNQRAQFAEQDLADRVQFALALQHAAEFREVGLQPILLAVAFGRIAQVGDHRVEVVFQLGNLAARFHLNRAGEVALGHRGRNFGDGADLGGQVGREQIDVAGEILPRAGGAGHVGLSAEPPVHADLARDVRHLIGEGRERIGHVVDGFAERGDLALGLHGQALAEIAVGDGGHHLHDAANLVGEVRRHEVDVVGEILPGAGHAGNDRLAAKPAFGADFARHARHFAGEGVELIDHRVDGVLQLQNLALHVDGDLAVEIAARHGGGDFGDVADLGGQGCSPDR